MNSMITELRKINYTQKSNIATIGEMNIHNNNEVQYRKGDIYYVDLGEPKQNQRDFNKRDCVQRGKRPAMLWSNQKCLDNSPVILVIPLTTAGKKKLPTHVEVDTSFGLESNSIILCEQIVPINKSDILFKLCTAPESVLTKVEKALKVQTDMIDKPDEKILNDYVKRIFDVEDTIKEFEYLRQNERANKYLMKKMEYIDDLYEYCDKFRIDAEELIDKKREETNKNNKNETKEDNKVVYLRRNFA